jgi:hypothetical protein
MKKNYFYAIIQEEFALLLAASRTENLQEIHDLQNTCLQRHKSVCVHLLKDFITPMQREDLYAVSSKIFAVFSTLFRLSSSERKCAEQSVLLLSATPFRFDETPLRRREDLRDLWKNTPHHSPNAQACFYALDSLAESLLIAAIKNA